MGSLRRTTERFLPLKDDEAQLSKRARRYVFVGGYINSSELVSVFANTVDWRERNWITAKYPYSLTPNRRSWGSGAEASGTSSLSKEPLSDVAEEMRNPQKLRRANHVERFARRVKVGAMLVAAAGLTVAIVRAQSDVVTGTVAGIGAEPVDCSKDLPCGAAPVCGYVAAGAEPLEIVAGGHTYDFQTEGITVCISEGLDQQANSSVNS